MGQAGSSASSNVLRAMFDALLDTHGDGVLAAYHATTAEIPISSRQGRAAIASTAFASADAGARRHTADVLSAAAVGRLRIGRHADLADFLAGPSPGVKSRPMTATAF